MVAVHPNKSECIGEEEREICACFDGRANLKMGMRERGRERECVCELEKERERERSGSRRRLNSKVE